MATSKVPLMPKATAMWLVENTTLTFEQIADYCGLHELEVQGIADGEVATGIQGIDPIANGQLAREELERCQENPRAKLKMARSDMPMPVKRTKGPRYTPVAKRQDKPDAIAWLLRHHPELTDSQVSRLIGTTKQTIAAIRDRSHWNYSNLRPRDPVLLGICTQTDLNAAVLRARRALERAGKELPKAEPIAQPEPEREQSSRSQLPGGIDISKLFSTPSSGGGSN